MRPVLVPALDGFVREKPDVASASLAAARAPPPLHIRLILVRNAERQPVQRHVPAGGEVKDELVAVVDEPRAIDGLVVAERQVPVDPRRAPHGVPVDRDGFHPVQRVLQLQVRPRRQRDVDGRPRVGRTCADVEKERPVGREHPRGGLHPLAGPLQVPLAGQGVRVCAVANTQVVRRRRDDGTDRAGRERRQQRQAISVIEAKGCAGSGESVVRTGRHGLPIIANPRWPAAG